MTEINDGGLDIPNYYFEKDSVPSDGDGLTDGNSLTDGDGLGEGDGLTDGDGLTNGNGLATRINTDYLPSYNMPIRPLTAKARLSKYLTAICHILNPKSYVTITTDYILRM